MRTQEFITMLGNSVDLCQKMQTCKAPEEAYNIAKAEGLTDSFEEFTAKMTKFHDSIKDLTEDDLTKVAGGLTEDEVATIVSTALSSVGITLMTVVGAAGAAAI